MPGEAERFTDRELVRRTASGDDHAFAELYRRHEGPAHSVAVATVGPSDADEVAADAFVRILGRIREGAEIDSMRAYVTTSVRRLGIDRLRARARLVPADDVVVGGAGHRVGAASDDPEVEQSIEQGLAVEAFLRLPQRWQHVLWLVDVEGMRPRQAARAVGLTPNAVSALAGRARAGLREAYERLTLDAFAPDVCRRMATEISAWAEGHVDGATADAVDDHIESCDRCGALAAHASAAGDRLPALIGIVPGVGGGGTLTGVGRWLSRSPDPVRVGAAVAVGVASVAGALAISGLNNDEPASRSAPAAEAVIDVADRPHPGVVDQALPASAVDPPAAAVATPARPSSPSAQPAPAAAPASSAPGPRATTAPPPESEVPAPAPPPSTAAPPSPPSTVPPARPPTPPSTVPPARVIVVHVTLPLVPPPTT